MGVNLFKLFRILSFGIMLFHAPLVANAQSNDSETDLVKGLTNIISGILTGILDATSTAISTDDSENKHIKNALNFAIQISWGDSQLEKPQ